MQFEHNYIGGFSDELKKYLLVKYSKEPFPYEFSEQDLYTNIEKDIRAYCAGNMDVTIKNPSEYWQVEREYLQNLYIDKCREISELEDYIEKLEKMFLEHDLVPYTMIKQHIDF